MRLKLWVGIFTELGNDVLALVTRYIPTYIFDSVIQKEEEGWTVLIT